MKKTFLKTVAFGLVLIASGSLKASDSDSTHLVSGVGVFSKIKSAPKDALAWADGKNLEFLRPYTTGALKDSYDKSPALTLFAIVAMLAELSRQIDKGELQKTSWNPMDGREFKPVKYLTNAAHFYLVKGVWGNTKRAYNGTLGRFFPKLSSK